MAERGLAKKITQKMAKHDEFVEAAFDIGLWLEEHGRTVAKWAGAGVLALIVVVAYSAYLQHRGAKHRALLADVIGRYEQAESGGFVDRDALAALLEPLEQAARGRGASGRLARFYRGAALLHLERLDEARDELARVVEQDDTSDTLGATAQILLARVHGAAGRTDEAVALLERLADPASSAAVPPEQVLLELGRLYREVGKAPEAQRQWERIVREYPESVAAGEARALLR
jgi:predicted negative regulator of RcsB-dependent stress response